MPDMSNTDTCGGGAPERETDEVDMCGMKPPLRVPLMGSRSRAGLGITLHASGPPRRPRKWRFRTGARRRYEATEDCAVAVQSNGGAASRATRGLSNKACGQQDRRAVASARSVAASRAPWRTEAAQTPCAATERGLLASAAPIQLVATACAHCRTPNAVSVCARAHNSV